MKHICSFAMLTGSSSGLTVNKIFQDHQFIKILPKYYKIFCFCVDCSWKIFTRLFQDLISTLSKSYKFCFVLFFCTTFALARHSFRKTLFSGLFQDPSKMLPKPNFFFCNTLLLQYLKKKSINNFCFCSRKIHFLRSFKIVNLIGSHWDL